MQLNAYVCVGGTMCIGVIIITNISTPTSLVVWHCSMLGVC